MIIDYEQELTAAGGQLFNATDGNAEYGSRPYDLKTTTNRDIAVGEPLEAWAMVTGADCDVGTSYDLEIVNDTDGAGGSEVSLAKSSAVLVAALTEGTAHRIGRIAPGDIVYQYLTAKVTTHGTTPTGASGKLKIWFQKASDGVPVNAGFTA